MSKVKDLTGCRFGRLTVVGRAENTNRGLATWKCLCDCGNEAIIRGSTLRSGRTESCGCLHKELISRQMTTHKMSDTKIYKAWQNMKKRCYNQNSADYKDYGGRGIVVCKEWINDFEAFCDWAILNGYDDSLSIDRENVNGNYEPSNCRWATEAEQANNKRNSHFLTFNGETHTIAQWEDIKNIPHGTLKSRIYRGWSVEKTLTVPLRRWN